MTGAGYNTDRPDANPLLPTWSVAWITALAGGAALLGRIPALGAWWNQDDWGLLARAAGLAPAPVWPARWLSQDLYWRLLWPLAGLDPDPYAWTRLLLLAAAAALTARLGLRAGLGGPGALLAGLLVAATPLAFTPLYWASGVQELLAVTLLLAALERWLAGGRGGVGLAILWGIGSMAAKEVALGLPLALGASLLFLGPPPRTRPALAWTAVAILTLAAAIETILVLNRFQIGAAQPYALGDAASFVSRLGAYGLWLVTPTGSFAVQMGAVELGVGLAVWGAWLGWGVGRWSGWPWSAWRWKVWQRDASQPSVWRRSTPQRNSRRRGRHDPLPLATALLALISLAPALALRHHIYPYLALVAVPALGITLGGLVLRAWRPRPVVAPVAALVAAATGFLVMDARLTARDETGLLADDLVLRTAVSYDAAQEIRLWPRSPTISGIVLLVPLTGEVEGERTARLGESFVPATLLYSALGGPWGPRMQRGQELEEGLEVKRRAGIDVVWRNGLRESDPSALVFVDAGLGFKPWGETRQALLYLTLTEVGRGLYARARQHLLRAATLDDADLPFAYDPQLLLDPVDRVVRNAPAFRDFLTATRAQGASDHEITALQQIFRDLLAVLTGTADAGAARTAP